MAKHTAVGHGSRFQHPDHIAYEDPWEEFELLEKFCPDCAWEGCQSPRFFDMPVCLHHAAVISQRFNRGQSRLRYEDDPRPVKPPPTSYVYYLMVGPNTLKIGTTSDLRMRMTQLRTDVQYVVALEVGDHGVELQRHRQFAAERHGRREDFALSDRLKAHIEAIQPQRDELILEALTYRSRPSNS